MESFGSVFAEPQSPAGPAHRPQSLAEIDVPQAVLENLALKNLYVSGSLSVLALSEKLCLSFEVATALYYRLRAEQLCQASGMDGNIPRLAITAHGRARRAGGAVVLPVCRRGAGVSGELCGANPQAKRDGCPHQSRRRQPRLRPPGHRQRDPAAAWNGAQLRQLDLSLWAAGGGQNHHGRDLVVRARRRPDLGSLRGRSGRPDHHRLRSGDYKRVPDQEPGGL